MKLSIVTKIVFLFLVITATFTGVTYYQLSQTQSSAKLLYEMNSGYVPLSKIVVQIDSAQKSQQADIDRILATEDTSAQAILGRLVLNYFPRIFTQYLQQGAAHCDTALLVTESRERIQFYTSIHEKLDDLKKKHEEYLQQAAILLEKMKDPQNDDKTAAVKIKEFQHQLAKSVKSLTLEMDNELTKRVRELETQGDRATWAGIFLSAAALLLGIILTILVAFLLKPIQRLTEAAQKIGQGEYRYTVNISSGDELGTLAKEFENMRLSLIQRDRQLTEQAKKLENSNVELNTLKVHYENIINNLQSPVLVADVQLRLRTVNPAAQDVWGGNLKEYIGKSIASIPLLEGTLGDAILFERILLEKSTIIREALKVARSDGDPRAMTFAAMPLLDGENVRGLMCVAEDVTDELRMRDSLLRSERLAAVGKISSKIAHEIRNPLSSIALNTEMLEEELAAENAQFSEMKPLLNAIVKEVERLHNITEDYLKFARLPATERKPVNLNQLIIGLSEFYRVEMSKKNIECQLDVSKSRIVVEADENQLVRVFHNLFKNAIEAMENGGRIEVSLFAEEETAVIHVVDTGPGVPDEIAEKIFEPFYSTKKEGTGLGLAMSQQMVSDLNGQLRLQKSDEGKGAHFIVRLPLNAVMDHDEDSEYV